MTEITEEMVGKLRDSRRRARLAVTKLPMLDGCVMEMEWDADAFMNAWRPLRLDPDYALRLFIRKDGANAVSWLFAVPKALKLTRAETGRPEDKGVVFPAPKLPGALRHFMLAIRGDGSPISYLLASMLARDGQEVAARWHGVSWGCHQVLFDSPLWPPEQLQRLVNKLLKAARESPIDEVELLLSVVPDGRKLRAKKRQAERKGKVFDIGPDELFVRLDCSDRDVVQELVATFRNHLIEQSKQQFLTQHGREPEEDEWARLWSQLPEELFEIDEHPNVDADWAWEDEPPTDWTPSITMADDGSAEVRFLTYSGHMPERIVEHRDIFAGGSYLPATRWRKVGSGQGGYIH